MQMHRDSSFSHCFHSTAVDTSHTSLVCVDTAVCRTACSSTPVQCQMELISYLLIGTVNLHCVLKPLQFYSWLVCCSTMLFMSVGTQSHVHYFKNALNDLKVLVISSFSFQDDQEFNPTASQLCKISFRHHSSKFYLAELMAHCCKSGQKWLVLADSHNSLHDLTNSWSMVLSHCRVLKEVKTLAYVALLQDTVSYPHRHFTMTLPKFGCYLPSKFCLPWHLYFPHGYILSFQLINLTDLTESTSHCWIHSHHCGSTPVKSCYFIILLKNSNLHASCLNSRQTPVTPKECHTLWLWKYH